MATQLYRVCALCFPSFKISPWPSVPWVAHEGSDKTLTPQQDYFRVGGEHDSQLGEPPQKSQTGGMARNTMAVSTPVLCAFAILADTRDDKLEPTPWVTGIPST
jgi:hypothetical protein